MNTITWLLMGHLVGDWLLQNDWMAKGKRAGLVAIPGLVHYTVYTVIVLIFLAFDGGGRYPLPLYIIIGLIVFITHWLLDATHFVGAWMRFYHQTGNQTVRLMVDQTFHFLVLTVVAVIVQSW